MDRPIDDGFIQAAPRLGNQYDDDAALRSQLTRLLPEGVRAEVEPTLRELGQRAVDELAALGREAEARPPTVRHYDAWGRRVDRIEVSPAWQALLGLAAELGLVSTAYERRYGAHSRVVQLALVHLYGPPSAVASCPLAMTDGCARVLETEGRDEPFARATYERLISRDPATAWTAGQWMTEKEGGSDVGRSSTVARCEDGVWRLYGTKFFTSATTSECALTLARPEGAPAGSRGLSLFYLEPWREDGSANRIMVRRLKEKLGTKALPTAELELLGAVAHPVGAPEGGGLRRIARVLNICRYWNAMSAAHSMRRAVALAVDYAERREAFGARLSQLPLHGETLASMQVTYEAGLAVSLRVAELLGKEECGEASERERTTRRLLTPLAKLLTGKQAVAVASEALESFGGAGYMEDTGLPRLLRDAQVLPIWEGTTNVLSLDALRAIAREDALRPLLEDTLARLDGAGDARLAAPVRAVREACGALGEHLPALHAVSGEAGVQAGARAFALSLARTAAAALLVENAAAELARGVERGAEVARRWVARGLCELHAPDAERRRGTRLVLGWG